MDNIRQQAQNKIFKNCDPASFQLQLANGELEKPKPTATLKLHVEVNNFAEKFVQMKELTGLIIGLQYRRHISLVIDTTLGLILFPDLITQVKSAKSKKKNDRTPTCHQRWLLDKISDDNINEHCFRWSLMRKESNVYCDPLEKFTKTWSFLISHSKSIKFDKKSSHQGDQHKRITLNNEKGYTDFQFIRSGSYAIEPSDTAICSFTPRVIESQ